MIYFDHNATTPVDERVLEVMWPYLVNFHGNASSLYRLGRLSRNAVEQAREQVAALVGAKAAEVHFTSGGTEANNLAIKGMAFAMKPGLALAGATEHPSVAMPIGFLARQGWQVEVLPADAFGCPDLSCLRGMQSGTFRFLTHMMANNETGVVHDVGFIGEAVKGAGGYFHVDAVQAAGRIPVDFTASGAHAMSLSAHKIYGPKGVGALVIDRGLPVEPLLHGGIYKHGVRAGTENVAGIVGFGKAAELALQELESRRSHMLGLRQYLESGLSQVAGAVIFAGAAERLPNTVCFGLAGYDGEALVMALDQQGFALSSGSACSSGSGAASPVLIAMGIDEELARTAVRVSLGKANHSSEIDRLLASLQKLANVGKAIH